MNDLPSAGRTFLDRDRRVLSVARRLMPPLLALHADQSIDDSDALIDLEAAGVTRRNVLDPLVGTMIDTMINPLLIVTAEVEKGREQRLVTFWATATRAVVGATNDRLQFELVQIEPGLLPFHLAQATGATPRPSVAFTGGCALPRDAFRFAATIATTEPQRAAATLRARGISWVWAQRIVAALAMKQSSWTVDSVWLEPDNRRARSHLGVLDAGRAGFWRLREPAESDVVSLQVVGFDEILGLLFSLLPDRHTS